MLRYSVPVYNFIIGNGYLFQSAFVVLLFEGSYFFMKSDLLINCNKNTQVSRMLDVSKD